MSQGQLIADLVKSASGILKMHLADLSDAELMTRPVPGANHARWQLAHLASLECMLAKLASPDDPVALPAEFADVGKGSAAAGDDSAAFPTKAQTMDLLERAHAAQIAGLPKMTDEQLAAESPAEFRSFAPRMGDLMSMGPMHTMMHLGQIQVLRRALGKPRVF